MVEGMKSVKEYNGQVTAYLSCLEQEMNTRVEAAGPDAPAEQIEQIKAIHTKRHNAAVEALEQHAARFNEQVKDLQGARKEELNGSYVNAARFSGPPQVLSPPADDAGNDRPRFAGGLAHTRDGL